STSNTIAVSWAAPAIGLAANTTQPAYQGNFTLTATSSYPVDNSGYVDQVAAVAGGSLTVLQQCTTGSTCVVSGSCQSVAATMQFQAFIGRGDPSSPVAASQVVSIQCPAPPPTISLAASDQFPYVSETVTLTATTNFSVSGTNDFIQIIDITGNTS